MSDDSRTRNVNRNAILIMLWRDDIAGVARTAIPARLQRGEEFVDLQLLERGVQRALGATAPMGGVLPRKAVQETTWRQIVAQLSSHAAR